jgi:hypothetical protein
LLALVQAHVRSLSKKDRDRFLADVAHSLGAQAAAHNVLRFRPRTADTETLRAPCAKRRAWYSARRSRWR